MTVDFKFREPDMGIFTVCHPELGYIGKIFKYDFHQLEQTPAVEISRYVIALSQYMIYFKSKSNETNMLIMRKQKLLEDSISQIITSEDIKKYKTKKDARAHLILNNQVLNMLQLEIDELREESFMVDGIDKATSDYISVFKRELTRRENELYQTRHGGR